jgi:hypothetical protein
VPLSPVLCCVVQIGPGILKQVAEAYRKLRGTLRCVCPDQIAVLLQLAVHVYCPGCSKYYQGAVHLMHGATQSLGLLSSLQHSASIYPGNVGITLTRPRT